MQQVTWKWLEESLFPLLVRDARRAGEDTTGWALDSRSGQGRMFCRLGDPDPDTGARPVLTVYHRFTTPRQADLMLQGMRFAWARVTGVMDRFSAGQRQETAGADGGN
jgi:hypothetical protein